ncbi:hypothetical protein Tco_0396736 [Tanacetum coccineum]
MNVVFDWQLSHLWETKLLFACGTSGLTLQEQVIAILETKDRLFCYNCNGECHIPDSAPNQREKGMTHGFKEKVLLFKTQVANCTKTNLENKSVNNTLTAELERYKEQVKVLKEGQNVELRSKDNVSDTCAQNPASKPKPNMFGDIFVQTNPISDSDSEETLALVEESHSKMLLKHKDNMMLEKKKQVDTTPIDYAALNQIKKFSNTLFHKLNIY